MRAINILIVIHYRTNIGYAIATLESVFYEMAKELVKNKEHIHFAYKSLEGGRPTTLPDEFQNIIAFDPFNDSVENRNFIKNYIADNNIDTVFGFDFPVSLPTYSVMREAGVNMIISYFGASMSSINYGLKLVLKRIEVALRRNKPNLFIFESEAMRRTAVNGRGINKKATAIVRLGVDTKKYKPDSNSLYTYELFNIPKDRKIVFYSGHMQRRKGVYVIVEAAAELINSRHRNDVHFLFLGNKNKDEQQFDKYYKHTPAEDFITFGGYRDDLPKILPCCYVGSIASTGWDSFTMSSLEMASAGLPLIVSNFQGLAETIEDCKTGYLFEPGNHIELANKIEYLLDRTETQKELSSNARKRVLQEFSKEIQIKNLVASVSSLNSVKTPNNTN